AKQVPRVIERWSVRRSSLRAHNVGCGWRASRVETTKPLGARLLRLDSPARDADTPVSQRLRPNPRSITRTVERFERPSDGVDVLVRGTQRWLRGRAPGGGWHTGLFEP